MIIGLLTRDGEMSSQFEDMPYVKHLYCIKVIDRESLKGLVPFSVIQSYEIYAFI